MPAQQPRPRHAAPKNPSRRRTALLPAVLLAAACTAFAGLAALPAAAVEVPPRVTAAAALQPVELPAAAPVEQQVNVALGTALAQGLAVANTPPPPPPPPPPERASRDRDAETTESSGGAYARPGTGRVTSQYGRRWGRLHAGVDIAAGMGAPIYAAADGTVKSAGSQGGYGRAIRILHGDGTVTVYAHMSRLLVSAGERVSAGEQIGKEGSTGQSTGPHLHFEVRVNGTPIDPISWLRKRGVDNI